MSPSDEALRRTLGLRLRALREARGREQKELASVVGISPGTLCNVEKGKTGLSLEVLVKLAEALDTSLDHLLGRERSEPSLRPVWLEADLEARRRDGRPVFDALVDLVVELERRGEPVSRGEYVALVEGTSLFARGLKPLEALSREEWRDLLALARRLGGAPR